VPLHVHCDNELAAVVFPTLLGDFVIHYGHKTNKIKIDRYSTSSADFLHGNMATTKNTKRHENVISNLFVNIRDFRR
jgi:hypothetical protein